MNQTTKTRMTKVQLIESDSFPFEFLSRLAERESWRKEIHRPIYHVHKWWAKRLGSVFRGILLGCQLSEGADLPVEFYKFQDLSGRVVFDPFMGSGTTIGEAHKLGFTALGRDINPVAVTAVNTALGPLHRKEILAAFQELSEGIGQGIRALYNSTDSKGRRCEVLYYFWVMQTPCPDCGQIVDLFPSYIVARNAYPHRKPEVQVVCPSCGDIFAGLHDDDVSTCSLCERMFNPQIGPAHGAKASCPYCENTFGILDAVARLARRPDFRLYGKLVLTCEGAKEYLPVSPADVAAYKKCGSELQAEVESGQIQLPDLKLRHGHNTRQAMSYGFLAWRDFFNDRQLLALGWLRTEIARIPDESTREALFSLFSGVLEFNNLFASYKGEGTGAVRHMFSHHILKPERTPIEANVWGTPKSSGSFSNLLRGRIMRAIEYRAAPTEVNGVSGAARVCAPPFSGSVESEWPVHGNLTPRGIYLSCGDSAQTGLPAGSVDLVVTDPPFFDNVHYSELADFFHAWRESSCATTRNPAEVQDSDSLRFAEKLQDVFRECERLLKSQGLLAFTYHHSRGEGWRALAEAILGAGFVVVNSQPVKAEMSVATPKAQAKEPIQFDIVVVCRKRADVTKRETPSIIQSLESARAKLQRLASEGFTLSRNDQRIVLSGQLLTTLNSMGQVEGIGELVDAELESLQLERPAPARRAKQPLLFSDG